MSYFKTIVQMAGSARSIDASLMPIALDENTYHEDIYALNYGVLLTTRNLAKTEPSNSRIFSQFSDSFLSDLLATPLTCVEKAINHSILMFTLEKHNNETLNKFFNTSSIQTKTIKSNQKSQLFLLREIARNDISAAQLISGLTIDELILLANQANDEISKTIHDNNFIYVYRGTEQALKQSFMMPESNNAKMISLAKLLQDKLRA